MAFESMAGLGVYRALLRHPPQLASAVNHLLTTLLFTETSSMSVYASS